MIEELKELKEYFSLLDNRVTVLGLDFNMMNMLKNSELNLKS